MESVLAQTGDFELEYIIRDGGSTDGTLEILNEYKERCILVSGPDGGHTEAINLGLAQAGGEIGCYLNADDILEPGSIQAVVETFTRYPACRWLYGRCRIIDEHNREIRQPVTWYKNLLGYFYSQNLLLCENYVNQPATFWKMDLWREIGGISPGYRLAFDYMLWLKMARKSRARSVHQYLAGFRRHAASISETSFVAQFNQELEISREFGTFCHYFLHWFSIKLRITIYKMLS
jgi:glycosyltransferase involved in cell wall biosynthesis